MKKLLRKLLSPAAISAIKNALDRFHWWIIPLFSKSGFLASLYYTFLNRQFYREHQTVLQGRLAYQKSLQNIGRSSVLLRRNVHRLEKGLIMRPRRPVFAEAYILETVNNYRDSVLSGGLCDKELAWATDVLKEYFNVVHSSKITDNARAIFEGVEEVMTSGGSLPYEHRTLPPLDINYEQLTTLFQRRRSVRWYQQRTVEPDKLAKAIEAASLAPSACNRQPFRFYVANDAAKAAKLANYAMGTTGFAENIPCLIVVVGDLSAYPYERDRHVIYIDGALASMQLMLALETQGLSSCPINWPDIESREKKMDKALGLSGGERPIMLMAVGYGDSEGGIPFSQKKGAELLIKEV